MQFRISPFRLLCALDFLVFFLASNLAAVLPAVFVGGWVLSEDGVVEVAVVV
jgi:hypothetical protein